MNISVNPQAPNPIYAQIVEQVSDMILGGNLVPGASLPSVRQLADRLEVNSLTIQKAYKMLEGDGLIVIKKGVGAFVNEEVKSMNKKERDQVVGEKLAQLIRQAQDLGVDKEQFAKMIDRYWR